MPRSIFDAKRSEALQLLNITVAVVLVVFLLSLFLTARCNAFSVFAGSLIWLLPNFYFAGKVFSTAGTKTTPQRLLKNFYQAEIVKLALYAILFIIVVKFLAVVVLPLLIGFGLAQITFWIAPFLLQYVKRLKSK